MAIQLSQAIKRRMLDGGLPFDDERFVARRISPFEFTLELVDGGETTAELGEPDATGWCPVLRTGLYGGAPVVAGQDIRLIDGVDIVWSVATSEGEARN